MFSSRTCVIAAQLTLSAVGAASAQAPPATPAAPAPVTSPAGPARLHYGVRFGPSFTTLTNVDTLDETAAAAAFEPTLNFGGFVTFQLTPAMAFQPEVLFAAKGHRIRDKDAQPLTTPTGEVKLPAADR